MLRGVVWLVNARTRTVGRERGCSRDTFMEEGLTFLARHGCVCIRENETNGCEGVSGRVQGNETLGPYQQKNCSSLIHSVLLQHYVWEKMALSASGPYLCGVNVRTTAVHILDHT
jgi:hypothetical protein